MSKPDNKLISAVLDADQEAFWRYLCGQDTAGEIEILEEILSRGDSASEED